MCFGADYGARAERGDLKLVYSYLEEELTANKQFDAILLPLTHGWNRLTPPSREALLRRVSDGCGLVLIRPFANELCPLAPIETPPLRRRARGPAPARQDRIVPVAPAVGSLHHASHPRRKLPV